MPLEFDPERRKTVRLIREGKTATVRFATHVLYFETLTRLREIVDSLLEENEIETLYFETEGKNFLLGADIDFFSEAIALGRQDEIMRYSDLGNDLFDAIERFPCPTIARIDGAALGGGFELALACSGRVATPGSSFAFPEIGLGIFPGWGGIKRLQRRIGSGLARWIVLTSKSLAAPLAAELKIVDRLISQKELIVESERLADEIRRNGPRPSLEKVPENQQKFAELFESPVEDILARQSTDREIQRVLDQLKRRPSVSLRFAERIFNAARTAPPTLERRFEDTLTWTIYHSPDAAIGLNHARAGKMGTPTFSGRLPE